MSLDDLSGEHWELIPVLENRYVISNKGSVKRLTQWTIGKNKTF
ncbi:NUMOD4 domain-containing protein [Chryseobacterium oleae]